MTLIPRMIPPQLHKARFIKIDMTDPENRQWKKPKETNWQKKKDEINCEGKNNYAYDDPRFIKYLATGDNIGVALGYDDIIVIDADHIVIDQEARKSLPKTFTVKTGSYYYNNPEVGRKTHFYYRCPELPTTISLANDPGGNHYGEIRGTGAMVIGSGSKHYKTGNIYTVENDIPIATITLEQINTVFAPYMKEHDEKQQEQFMREHRTDSRCPLDITKVINPADFKGQTKTEKSQGIYRGKHPGHNSGTNRDFIFNINTNLWWCYSHETGGGPIELIAILEGVIKCSEVKPGCLKKKE